jgi:hypothetical protein
VAVEDANVDKLYSGQVSAFGIGTFNEPILRVPDQVVANL